MGRNILITGGAGFIGSHVTNYFVDRHPEDKIIVLDSLTYASNYENVIGLNKFYETIIPFGISNLFFEEADIRDAVAINAIFEEHKVTHVIHLAAESHVDNSIEDPNIFVETNVMGTLNLLNACVKYWKMGIKTDNRFYHISTDEVYGALELDSDTFTEETPYAPHSPYSASKASSDHFVRAYHDTYGLPILISNCSNNYGPHQHTEKLIPKVISNLRDGKNIPIYGTGENIRDWLYVGDHVRAMDVILTIGTVGETYNIGGDNELTNMELVARICYLYQTHYVDEFLKAYDFPKESALDVIEKGSYILPVEFVEDRKGHDLRYGINSSKLQKLGWEPKMDFEEGLMKTIKYYLDGLHTT